MRTAAEAALHRLRVVKERWRAEEPDRFGIVAVSSSETQGHVELLQHEDPQVDLARALMWMASRAVDLPHTGWVPVIITLDEDEYSVDVAVEGIDGPIRLRFADGSEQALPAATEPVELAGQTAGSSSASATLTVTHSTDADIVGLDRGPALLEPITVEEFASIETLIGELYRAHALDQLEPHDARKILELADLLKDVTRTTTPNETPRWRPIGAIGAVLRRLFQAPFRDALALSQILQILAKIKWSDLAQELQQLLS